jgi:hypothetical protein
MEETMSTANRIVLLNRTGEELFSGESVFSEPPVARPASAPLALASDERERPGDDEEPIPPTLRSGVFAREPVSRPIIVDDATPPKDDADHRAA